MTEPKPLPEIRIPGVSPYPLDEHGMFVLTPEQQAEIVAAGEAQAARCPEQRAAMIRMAHETEMRELHAEQESRRLLREVRRSLRARGCCAQPGRCGRCVLKDHDDREEETDGQDD